MFISRAKGLKLCILSGLLFQWESQLRSALFLFYATQNGSFSQKIRDNYLFRNVDKKLPFYAAQNPETAHLSFTLRRKPEIIRIAVNSLRRFQLTPPHLWTNTRTYVLMFCKHYMTLTSSFSK